MTLPRTVADVLSDHVVFEVECIDRMYLNVYVPTLQTELALVSYLRGRGRVGVRRHGRPVKVSYIMVTPRGDQHDPHTVGPVRQSG
jgi:hypothetical protein